MPTSGSADSHEARANLSGTVTPFVAHRSRGRRPVTSIVRHRVHGRALERPRRVAALTRGKSGQPSDSSWSSWILPSGASAPFVRLLLVEALGMPTLGSAESQVFRASLRRIRRGVEDVHERAVERRVRSSRQGGEGDLDRELRAASSPVAEAQPAACDRYPERYANGGPARSHPEGRERHARERRSISRTEIRLRP